MAVKIVSGDDRIVTAHLAQEVGLRPEALPTGSDIARLPPDALARLAVTTDVVAKVEPAQKERIVLALQKTGHVTGFLGDGINDAPALHAADMVPLRPDFAVLARGIDEGRRTFANTLNYLTITTSANLGNMTSVAVASPVLPLLAKQILLTNLLSDLPMLALAGDRVEADRTARPVRWDLGTLRRRALLLGGINSAFDLLTFAVLRTTLPLRRSRPDPKLVATALVAATVGMTLPFLPGSAELGFVPLPPAVLVSVVTLALLYAAATGTAKHRLRAEERSSR